MRNKPEEKIIGIELSITEDLINDNLIQLIRHFAVGKLNDVACGAEKPELASLLLQKYGQGVIDASALVYRSPKSITEKVAKILEDAITTIDPSWQKQERT